MPVTNSVQVCFSLILLGAALPGCNREPPPMRLEKEDSNRGHSEQHPKKGPATKEQKKPEPTTSDAAAISESDLQTFRSSRYGTSLKHPKSWRADDDNEKVFVMYPATTRGAPVGSVGVRRPWADESSLEEWKRKREKEDPLYSTILLSSSKEAIQRRFETVGDVTILYWSAKAEPNFLLDLDPSVKELTLHVIEIAQVDGGKVTSTMVWASYPSDSAQLQNEAQTIVRSMRFDGLKPVPLTLP